MRKRRASARQKRVMVRPPFNEPTGTDANTISEVKSSTTMQDVQLVMPDWNSENHDAVPSTDGSGDEHTATTSEPSPMSSVPVDHFAGREEPPSPAGVEEYRLKLEERLGERYNNLPEYAGRVGKVSVVLSKPLDISLDGKLIKAEFDQLVYDNWGNRLPALEKEYYVVTFGTGGALQVRADPSIRVGLDLEKTYSERAPLAGDPFRNIEDAQAFTTTPKAKMPSWWRPEYQE